MDSQPNIPIPISYVGAKYLLFDINAITWLRRVHHICGVMQGTLPQSPSQNVFLGLPVQLMPEEAQLLVDNGVAYIIDDAQVHEQAMRENGPADSAAYLADVRRKEEQVWKLREEEKEEARRQSMKKSKGKAKSKSTKGSSEQPQHLSDHINMNSQPEPNAPEINQDDAETDLFDSTSTIKPPLATRLQQHMPIVVPTTSTLLLPPLTPPTPPESQALLPNVPSSYALYKHLNSKSYYMTPGLRFGCQYSVYPGDPLRFHSHFLAVGKEWDEEINLMDIVGGGRLGTGVKKGFLIGGLQPGTEPGNGEEETREETVRTFSIEWAAM